MNTLTIALNLLIAQGLLGAFDVLFHHEMRAALPQQVSAATELRIHAVRSMLYGILFAGLAWFTWGGLWLGVLAGIILIEVLLTLWDFVVEDSSRLLPPSERVLHTILAINGGAIIALLCLQLPVWWTLPNNLIFVSHDWQSIVLSVLAFGVNVSGVRDGCAAHALRRRCNEAPRVHFVHAPQHILITGGTGFIGQILCRALLADGHELTLLVRNPLKAAYLFNGRVRSITTLDQLNPEICIDAVINLAGERIVGWRWTTARKQALITSRVDTTRALVEWIARARHKPRLMISASAVGYYGVQSQSDPTVLKEDTPGQPVFVSELCQHWEAAAREVSQYGIPLAVLRLGLVFGYQGVLPAMRAPFMFGIGGSIGEGRQVMSWVHIDDVLGVMAHLMNNTDPKQIQGVYNVTAPQPITQREFAHTLGRVWHRPSVFTTPAVLFRWLLGEQATLMLDGQRVAPAKLEHSGYRFLFPQLEVALQDLRSGVS